MCIVSQPLVPVRIVDVIGKMKQLGWIVIHKVTIVLAAHMVVYWVCMNDMDLTKRGSDSTDVTISICLVCVIIVGVSLCSGFASKE